MLDKKQVCIIVDAFSTGKYLVPGFVSAGYDCIHVQLPQNKSTPYKVSRDAYFIKDIIFDGNLENLLQQLKKYNVKLVVPGLETGVHLADLLNDALGLKESNGLELSKARRDKYLMVEALKSHAVRTVQHYKSSNLDDIKLFIKNSLSYPVILKPLDSTASDGVSYCHSETETEAAFEYIMNSKNYWGNSNKEVLVQSYLEGDEYVINGVSCEGRHFVTDIWKMHRFIRDAQAHRFVYDYAELIEFDSPEFAVLESYIHQVLSSLSVKFGASHSEVMLTKEGPVLIEMGARMEGAMDPSAIVETLGYSQVSKLIDSYLNPKEFLRALDYPRFKNRHHVVCVYLRADDEGIIKNEVSSDKITGLKSYHSGAVFLKPGDYLGITNFIKSGPNANPGYIYLVGDCEEVKSDYIKIREMEKTFYKDLIHSYEKRMDSHVLMSGLLEKKLSVEIQNSGHYDTLTRKTLSVRFFKGGDSKKSITDSPLAVMETRKEF